MGLERIVLDGNCAVGCVHGTDYPYIRIFQCMLERTDSITNEVLEPVTFVLTYFSVFASRHWIKPCLLSNILAFRAARNITGHHIAGGNKQQVIKWL